MLIIQYTCIREHKVLSLRCWKTNIYEACMLTTGTVITDCAFEVEQWMTVPGSIVFYRITYLQLQLSRNISAYLPALFCTVARQIWYNWLYKFRHSLYVYVLGLGNWPQFYIWFRNWRKCRWSHSFLSVSRLWPWFPAQTQSSSTPAPETRGVVRRRAAGGIFLWCWRLPTYILRKKHICDPSEKCARDLHWWLHWIALLRFFCIA